MESYIFLLVFTFMPTVGTAEISDSCSNSLLSRLSRFPIWRYAPNVPVMARSDSMQQNVYFSHTKNSQGFQNIMVVFAVIGVSPAGSTSSWKTSKELVDNGVCPAWISTGCMSHQAWTRDLQVLKAIKWCWGAQATCVFKFVHHLYLIGTSLY